MSHYRDAVHVDQDAVHADQGAVHLDEDVVSAALLLIGKVRSSAETRGIQGGPDFHVAPFPLQRQLKAQGVQLVNEADESTTGPASIAVDPDGNPILVDQHV